MKIVMMKNKKAVSERDMFSVLSLVQSLLAVSVIFILFGFTKVNSAAISDIRENLGVIFGEDMDMGGYFTPSEENTSEEEIESSAVLWQSLEEKAPEASEMDFSADDSAVMPVIGSITSDYGLREHPVYSGESFHWGRDIAAAEGSPIYSVLDGIVEEAGVAEKAGKYVKILHSDGTQALYCHCSELIAEKGDNVKKGDIIALVGQTGLATGPHLHFEYHKNGKAENPEEILSGAVNVR